MWHTRIGGTFYKHTVLVASQWGCSQLEGGEGGSRCYATLVALVPGHHDVTIHAPVRTPAADREH